MSTSSGKPTSATSAGQPPKVPPAYRPDADIAKVYRCTEQSLKEIVWEATHQACGYISLASLHYEDSPTARYGHLVDAAECLEIAMTHLGLLKSALAYRLAVETGDHTGTGTSSGADTAIVF